MGLSTTILCLTFLYIKKLVGLEILLMSILLERVAVFFLGVDFLLVLIWLILLRLRSLFFNTVLQVSLPPNPHE